MNRVFLAILILIAIGIIVFIGYRTGMFITPVDKTLETFCGNDVCEIGETKCSCSEDCGICEDYIGSCKRSYCSGNDCVIETVDDCCGNQKCELEECDSCLSDCKSEECGAFSVEIIDESILKGEKVGENTIIFNIDKKLISSYFILSIKSYDKDVKNLEVIYNCCMKRNEKVCDPVSRQVLWSYFFNPENAVLSEKTSSKVSVLNGRGSVNYLFSFNYFEDSLIPRTNANELKRGKHYGHCDLVFQSSEPDYFVIKKYDILFNVK